MSVPPKDIALLAQDLSFSYARPVVRGFSTALKYGAVTGIIGPNGCGKTTVLRLLDGILRPDSGQVLIDGDTPLSRIGRKEIARRVAVVPQNGGLYGPLTVFQFAMQGRSPHLSWLSFETSRDEDITLEALERTRLQGHAYTRVSELSGGEKQRLLLARALVQQPEILLLDEFTANLDINYQVELMELVARTTREQGLSTLVVSHEINLLAAFSDSIILMSEGTIRRQGPVAEVLSNESLTELFGLQFSVRFSPSGTPEVLPIIRTG
jgi:iron complex transport system ATP-binding protein